MDKLNILWTSGDPDTFTKMVAMYAGASMKNKWWDAVSITIWGASARLIAEREDVREALAKTRDRGVELRACRACAEQLGVDGLLEEMGVTVEYMGEPLTEMLKSGAKLLTI